LRWRNLKERLGEDGKTLIHPIASNENGATMEEEGILSATHHE